MQQRGRSEFADRFAGAAADTDYSRFPNLRSTSQYDIRAGAEALWTLAMRENADLDGLELDEKVVVSVLSAQAERWDDEGELVSVRYEEYWDATDEMGFSGLLMKDIKRELARKYLEGKKAEHIVVDNRDGIWLFLKDGLREAL